MLVYLIRNKINNKVYIGKWQGTHAEHRWKQHVNYALKHRGTTALSYAIRKYSQNFQISVLSTYASSPEDLVVQA